MKKGNVLVSFMIPNDLKTKLQNEAKSKGLAFSSYLRLLLISRNDKQI